MILIKSTMILAFVNIRSLHARRSLISGQCIHACHSVVTLSNFSNVSIPNWILGGTLLPIIDDNAMAWPLCPVMDTCHHAIGQSRHPVLCHYNCGKASCIHQNARVQSGARGKDTDLRRGKYRRLLSRSGFPISRIAPVIYIGWSNSFQNPGSGFHGRGLASTFWMRINAPLHGGTPHPCPCKLLVGFHANRGLAFVQCHQFWSCHVVLCEWKRVGICHIFPFTH